MTGVLSVEDPRRVYHRAFSDLRQDILDLAMYNERRIDEILYQLSALHTMIVEPPQ